MYTFFVYKKNFFEENQPQKPQNLKKMLRKLPTCKSIGRCVFRKTLSNIQYGTFCKNEYRQKLIFAKQLIFVEWFIVDVWEGSKNFIFTLLCSATKESVHILRVTFFPDCYDKDIQQIIIIFYFFNYFTLQKKIFAMTS